MLISGESIAAGGEGLLAYLDADSPALGREGGCTGAGLDSDDSPNVKVKGLGLNSNGFAVADNEELLFLWPLGFEGSSIGAGTALSCSGEGNP
jgi:hypothetical protein